MLASLVFLYISFYIGDQVYIEEPVYIYYIQTFYAVLVPYTE